MIEFLCKKRTSSWKVGKCSSVCLQLHSWEALLALTSLQLSQLYDPLMEKTNALSFHFCPPEEEDIWDGVKMTTVPLKILLCWKLMNVCNLKVLFECLTRETESFNSTFRAQSPPKWFNSFLQLSWNGCSLCDRRVGSRKIWGEFCCYSSTCFVVFACNLLQRPSKV